MPHFPPSLKKKTKGVRYAALTPKHKGFQEITGSKHEQNKLISLKYGSSSLPPMLTLAPGRGSCLRQGTLGALSGAASNHLYEIAQHLLFRGMCQILAKAVSHDAERIPRLAGHP